MPFRGGEFGLIGMLKDIVGPPGTGVIAGIGDDAAVLIPPTGRMLVTMDMLVEGVHFDLSFITPWQLGAKALAVNVSDIAAMGGRPLYTLVSLGASDRQTDAFVQELYEGMAEMAKAYGVSIVGGDTVRSPGGLLIDVVVIGEAASPVLRSGARAGQLIGVTGCLGGSGAGLAWLTAEQGVRAAANLSLAAQDEIITRHLEPMPRVRAGQALAASGGVTAMMDISDGLASEVNHLARESGVGMEVWAESIPIGPGTREAAAFFGVDPLQWALEGGEDYELVFTFWPAHEEAIRKALESLNIAFSVIGQALPPENGVSLTYTGGQRRILEARGYSHFH